MNQWIIYGAAAAAAFKAATSTKRRIELSLAKHRSLRGHARMERFVSRLIPSFSHEGREFFATDAAPDEIVTTRRRAFEALADESARRSPKTLALGRAAKPMISDMNFTNAYRVPFQYRRLVEEKLGVESFVEASHGRLLRDLDGNEGYDLIGAYGMNVLGFDFYKGCIERGLARVADLGPVLGVYHPIVADNAARILRWSGMDEVSFHMSGTEAVMQAVRLARYHTRRKYIVRFCGAYHGWSDGLQPGAGNPHPVKDTLTLTEMAERTLHVLETRKDIACVLINPIQAMHPNGGAPSDSALVASDRKAAYDRSAYSAWLAHLQKICNDRGIVFIMDEVFQGFRLSPKGAQDYFGVRADLVTYGKTLGGGLPVGVLCGTHRYMKRFRDDRPADICFARGTFNSHPLVMATMNEFLRALESEEVQARYRDIDEVWNRRASRVNARLAEVGAPVTLVNMTSIFTTLFTRPCRYNWMFQYYLRAEGLILSWVGSGRFVFSHDYTEADFDAVADRFVAAAKRMLDGGWWWHDVNATNKSIKRDVLRKIVRTVFGRRSPSSQPRIDDAPTDERRIDRAARSTSDVATIS